LWIEHLALALTGLPEAGSSWLIAQDGTWRFSKVSNAEKILQQLLDLYALGLTKPLPFFPASSFAFANPKGKKTPTEQALAAWEGNEDEDLGKGDLENPYFDLCFRNVANPLDDEFELLAKTVVEPLLAHRTEEPAP
jgi:exodeoxyribonuclease V gamma subunit